MPTPSSVAAAPVWLPGEAVAADYSGRSNLALAFLCLPKDKRADMDVFYTFCRLVDDIADSEKLPAADKAACLKAWRAALRQPDSCRRARAGDRALLADQLQALIIKYRLPVTHFLEIIAGVEMDLAGRRYADWDELRAYCYRVASVVGLVSVEIFGCRPGQSERYAVDLGLALQLTNIVRDVGTDLDNGGRIYLPLADMTRFDYPVEDLEARIYDRRFLALMEFEAQRAEEYYASAVRSLPREDRRALVAAEIMRAIYHRLLRRMRRDGFRVLDRRYRLGKAGKLWTLAATAFANRVS